jgi:hypothetical protein
LLAKLKDKISLEDLCVDERIILKWIKNIDTAAKCGEKKSHGMSAPLSCSRNRSRDCEGGGRPRSLEKLIDTLQAYKSSRESLFQFSGK